LVRDALHDQGQPLLDAEECAEYNWNPMRDSRAHILEVFISQVCSFAIAVFIALIDELLYGSEEWALKCQVDRSDQTVVELLGFRFRIVKLSSEWDSRFL
jgi:hypothetical protein